MLLHPVDPLLQSVDFRPLQVDVQLHPVGSLQWSGDDVDDDVRQHLVGV